jgi:hypothetical protein
MGARSLRSLLIGGVAVCAAALIVACSGSPVTPPPPPPVNTPPQIKSITVSDTRIEVGGPSVTVTAVVEDQETAPANLTYAWSAETGTFTGAGAIVTWSPSSDARTPADVILTLTVTERYASGATTAEHTVTSTLTVHVNNSPKELADLSLRFLGDFADSKVSPDKCVSEFSDTCASGKADEHDDITRDRHDFLHLSSTLRHTGLSIAADRRTATVHTFCSFTSRVITNQPISNGCVNNPGSCPFNGVGTAEGDCWTTNVYEQGRWWLCASHYTPKGIATDFERAFFGIRR